MEKFFESHQYLFSFLFGLFTSIGTIGANSLKATKRYITSNLVSPLSIRLREPPKAHLF